MSAKRKADKGGRSRKPAVRATPKQKLLKVLKWSSVCALVMALLAVGGFVVLYNSIKLPDPNQDFQTQSSFVYYSGGKQEIGRFETQNRESIPLREMPETLQDAVVAAENQSFWSDKGIDPKGIVRAAFSNASGNSQQGASTITQQYIKIMYLNQERSYKRKVKEAILSLKIQRQLSKQEILEGYLNTIFFGRNAYGVQAAAKAYFNVPASKLNLKQSAALASMINNPNNLDPVKGKASKKQLKARYRYTIDSMVKTDAITQQEGSRARRNLPVFPTVQAESRLGGQRGHMLTLVRSELNQLGFSDDQIDRNGLRVTTTFDPTVMSAAKEAVLTQRPEGFGDKELHVGAATVEVGTGAVRGFYGGQDFLQSQINWAATGGMAGSTMKAYADAAALKEGFALKDSFNGNSPYRFPGGLEVSNQGHHSYGRVSMITATMKSINTAYMDMTESMTDGPKRIYEMARRMAIPPSEAEKQFPGIPSTSPDFAPDDTLVSLGRARVSPINMANGYATIANRGKRADAYVVQKVVDADGKMLYSHKNATKRVVDEGIADDTSYALQQTVQGSGGTGFRAGVIGRPVAGKTGTATNAKDEVSSMWFVGYTPQLATAVMYVRGDGDDGLDGWLPDSTGGGYPARTWAALMGPALEGAEVESFPDPAWVDGEAPASGHEEYIPPPVKSAPPKRPDKKKKPDKTPSKTNKPKPTKTPKPSNTPAPPVSTPSQPPPEPSDPVTPSEPSTPTPTPTGGGQPGGGQSGGAGGSGGNPGGAGFTDGRTLGQRQAMGRRVA